MKMPKLIAGKHFVKLQGDVYGFVLTNDVILKFKSIVDNPEVLSDLTMQYGWDYASALLGGPIERIYEIDTLNNGFCISEFPVVWDRQRVLEEESNAKKQLVHDMKLMLADFMNKHSDNTPDSGCILQTDDLGENFNITINLHI